MAEINYSNLEAHISSASAPSCAYLICGEESFLRRKSLHRLRDAYMPATLPDFNYKAFDGESCSFEELATSIQTPPIMDERSLVEVTDLDFSALSSEQFETFKALIEQGDEQCTLILFELSAKSSARGKDRQGQIRALIAKNGTVINCKAPSRSEAADIISAQASEMKIQIARTDIYRLIDRCGTDLDLLVNELKRLGEMCGGKVSPNAIDSTAQQNPDVKGYMLASSVIQGNKQKAFAILQELLDDRTEPVAIIAMMSGSFTDLYRAKLVSDSGGGAAEMAERFSGEYKGKEKRLGYSMRDSRRFSLPLLREWCELLCGADVSLKSSRVSGGIILQTTLAKMFAAAEELR